MNHLYETLSPASLRILRHGRKHPNRPGELLDVQYEYEGKVYNGSAVIHRRASDWHVDLYHPEATCESCILHIVAENDAVICRTAGTVIPQLTMVVPSALQDRYTALINTNKSFQCGEVLSEMDDVKRNLLLTHLTIERLEQKYNECRTLYKQVDNNWHEVFYIRLFRSVNMGSNADTYEKLARTVSYFQICQVRSSLLQVEALLLGAAGFLETDTKDLYTSRLIREFSHLKPRFGIVPMYRNQWHHQGLQPNNYPILRIAELAALLTEKEHLFCQLQACVTPEDVHRVFSVTASGYWDNHYKAGSRTLTCTKKGFGTMMLDNFCINLVTPLLFTYGRERGDEEFTDRAINLLEQVGPEHNKYTRSWEAAGVPNENAFFSQGLLQLSREYCMKKRCVECNIGKMTLCCQ